MRSHLRLVVDNTVRAKDTNDTLEVARANLLEIARNCADPNNIQAPYEISEAALAYAREYLKRHGVLQVLISHFIKYKSK